MQLSKLHNSLRLFLKCEWHICTSAHFWLISLKSQWAYLIINHRLCTICLWTHSDGAHGGRYTLPLPTPPTPTPTHPYHHLPLPLPTTTHPYYPLPPPTPTTNNGLERSQVIGNVQMQSRSRRWIQTPPTPYHPPTLESTQLDLSSRNSNGSKRITVQMNSHKCTLKPNSLPLPLISISSDFFQIFITQFHFMRQSK